MPTNRRYRRHERRERYSGLDVNLKETLRTGSPFLPDSTPSIEILQQGWEEHGTDLLDEWLRDQPGSRPFAWWLFAGVPQYGERRTTPYFDQHHRREDFLLYGILHTHTWPVMQEEEVEYLRRHGLLTAGERRLLQKQT